MVKGPRTVAKLNAQKKADKAKLTAARKSAKVPDKVTKKVATKKQTAKKPTTKKAKAEPVEVDLEEEEEAPPENNVWLDTAHVKQLKLIRRNVNRWRKYLSDAIKNEYCCRGMLEVEDVFFHATEYLHGINVDVGFYEPEEEEAEPEETEVESESESESEPEPEDSKPAKPVLGPAAAYC